MKSKTIRTISSIMIAILAVMITATGCKKDTETDPETNDNNITLPDITGKAEPAPSSGCIITVPAARLRDLADQLTSENAPETKGALLALCVDCGPHP